MDHPESLAPLLRTTEILLKLLTKLKERQNFCPYCQREYVCEDDCELKGIWFKGFI